MGQVISQDWVSQLVLASTTSITMAPTYLGQTVRLTVGGQQYAPASTVTMNLASVGLNGLDAGALAVNTLYYIYAVQSGGALGLVASTSAPTTGPTGYASWKEIGRFRTFLGSAGAAAIANRILGNSSINTTSTWQSFTPSFNAITVITPLGRYRNISDSMEIVAQADPNGTATGNITLTIPNGFSINTASLSSTSGIAGNLGTALGRPINGGTAGVFIGIVQYSSANSVQIYGTDGSTYPGQGQLWSASFPAVWQSSGDALALHFIVPIAELVGLFD